MAKPDYALMARAAITVTLQQHLEMERGELSPATSKAYFDLMTDLTRNHPEVLLTVAGYAVGIFKASLAHVLLDDDDEADSGIDYVAEWQKMAVNLALEGGA